MKLLKKMTLTATAALLTALILPVSATESIDPEARLDNAATELKVRAALLETIGRDMLDVEVEAQAGQVTLTGKAGTQANSELAKEVALAMGGVGAVDNQIELDATQTEAAVGDGVAEAELEVQNAILESRVKGALIGELGLNALELQVEASDGAVSLRGALDSEEHRKVAVATARDISGVVEVVDLLDART
ncbi:MAG: BON domain-containing protein [Acidobacteriota bacterium]